MTNEEMLKIDATWTRQQLEAMTVVELTQVYNFNVDEDRQIKKFRTKEQGVERCLKVLSDKVVATGTTKEYQEDMAAGAKKAEEVAQRVEITPENIFEQNIPLTEPVTSSEVKVMEIEGQKMLVRETVTVHTNADSLGEDHAQDIAAASLPMPAPENQAEKTAAGRKKAVRGVTKLAEQMLRSGHDGENIIIVVQRKYIDEGGYSEAQARANAQNILAYVKEKVQKETPAPAAQ